MSVLLGWIALLGLCPVARTEMAPEFYKQMQQAAPEQLRIQVVSVRESWQNAPNGDTYASRGADVRVVARVVGVDRTRTGLRAGMTIRISYWHDTRRLAGPGPVPIVRTGTAYPAYLQKDAKTGEYAPAAGHASFDPLIRATP
jgi:hypothetical protein